MDIDPRFREQFDRLFEERGLTELDKLMEYHGPYDEPPLFTRYSQVSFLDVLSLEERNRILIRTSVAYLETILEYSRGYFADREHDYYCAVTVTGWDLVEEGDMVIPRFWFANPSHGVFEQLKLNPPTSKESRFVAACLDHDPEYVLADDIDRLERVWVQHVSCLAPVTTREDA